MHVMAVTMRVWEAASRIDLHDVTELGHVSSEPGPYLLA